MQSITLSPTHLANDRPKRMEEWATNGASGTVRIPPRIHDKIVVPRVPRSSQELLGFCQDPRPAAGIGLIPWSSAPPSAAATKVGYTKTIILFT